MYKFVGTNFFGKKNLFYLSILFCIALWGSRIYKLNLIILDGHLVDFHKLYFAAKGLIGGGESEFIATSSYGPPIIYVPYIPLTLLPFKLAEFVITYLSLFSYFLVFYLFWKRNYSKTSSFFWFFLGVLAFSFPIIYSLGMGNPIGIVLLGIYGFFIFKRNFIRGFFYGLASVLKLFPLIILPFLLIDKFKRRVKILTYKFKKFLLTFIGVTVTIFLFVPGNVWRSYYYFFSNLLRKVATNIDFTPYNQSFSSGVSRLGINVYTFSSTYWFYVLLLLLILIFYTFYLLKTKKKFDTEFYLFLISFTLLIHPFPWQYYYAIFLPFLMINIFKKKLAYIIVFLLLSLDGNRVHIYPLIDRFLMGSQFFGVLLFYLLIGLKPLRGKILKLTE